MSRLEHTRIGLFFSLYFHFLLVCIAGTVHWSTSVHRGSEQSWSDTGWAWQLLAGCRLFLPGTAQVHLVAGLPAPFLFVIGVGYGGGFRGGPSRLRPPPFGRRTDAVTHVTPHMWQLYYIMATPSPFLSLQARKTWYSEYAKWFPPVAFWQL